jgi:hypothetical protein
VTAIFEHGKSNRFFAHVRHDPNSAIAFAPMNKKKAAIMEIPENFV